MCLDETAYAEFTGSPCPENERQAPQKAELVTFKAKTLLNVDLDSMITMLHTGPFIVGKSF